MVGGFLGAGKTTTLLKLAAHLDGCGRRVGLITNDQSHGLVDTALVRSQGYAVEEITGGCFCCRFSSLTAAAERLTVDATPDVFLAEPVGSCTDLRASVQYPLRRMYGDDYRIAPLSVLVDPVRASRILGLEPGRAFSPKVLYVYRKQLEEADFIVINKADLMDAARLARLEAALKAAYPASEIFVVSAREGTGLERWFDRLGSVEIDDRRAPDVDYDEYADGEALLGWFNGTFLLGSDAEFDGNGLLSDLAGGVRQRLGAEDIEIAHLKMTLTPDDDIGDLAVLNLVAGDREPEASHRLQDALASGELIINLRAEGDPDILRATVAAALETAAAGTMRVETVHVEGFRPARPEPTYRLATAGGD